ncbi:MAG TPA: hypothetical protein VK601_01360, partial [Kofleriaceae bacterium]|nr:hypothetical protein [Kofleriaceae bacterium]
MERLPFLVEHGGVVWRMIAAIAAVLTIAIVRGLHARWERRSTELELAARSARTTGPIEGVATIRGTLRGGRARSVSLLHLRGRAPYYDERAPQLWLDCDGQRVVLDGPIRVVRGTRVVSTRNRRSALPRDEIAVRSSPILHRLTARTVSVGDGDPVFVTARLAPRPGDTELGYREATTAWTAAPPGGAIAIEVVAASPVVRAMPLGAARTFATGLAGAALAIAVLWSGGAIALWWARATGPSAAGLTPAALAELDAVALAAASPGNRGDALALLEARFADHHERTPASLALWRRAAWLRAGCGGELDARIAQDELDGMEALAEHCDDDRAAADAYQYLGMFREAAARDLERPAGERHIESLIAVGSWLRAAWWAAIHHDRTAVRGGAAGAAGFGCAERWFRALAGARADMASAAGFARQWHDPVCEVIAALAVRESERSAALSAAVSRVASDPRTAPITDALGWTTGAPRSIASILPDASGALHRAVFDPDDRVTIMRALLAGSAID